MVKDWREHWAEIKKRYPESVNIEGLEPALTSDIQELLTQERNEIVEELERYKANAQEHTKEDCSVLYQGCIEDAKAEAIRYVLSLIRDRDGKVWK